MNISVAGTGYVGLSIATLLAQHNDVTCVDVVPERVDLVNNKKSPIKDIGSRLFYHLMSAAAPSKLTPNATDFKLIDRKVINEHLELLRDYPEYAQLYKLISVDINKDLK